MWIENKEQALELDDKTGMLRRIRFADRKVELPSILWKVRLLCSGEYLTWGIADMTMFSHRQTGNSHCLLWENSRVKVLVKIVAEGEAFHMNIDVSACCADMKIDRVRFPILQGIGEVSDGGNDDYLLLPWQNGLLIRRPIASLLKKKENLPFYIGRGEYKYESEYPAALSYQFTAYYAKEKYGFYFQTEDADAHIKTFGYYYEPETNSMRFETVHYPQNMGKTSSYSMPYNFVFRLFCGDWQTCAGWYRQWAVKQKWCRMPLTEKQLPPKLVQTDLWRVNHTDYALGTRTQEFFDTAQLLQKKLCCKLGLHWYGWNMGKHDVDYPQYISAEKRAEGWPERLSEWNEKFTKAGIVKIPYVNGRLWEQTTDIWKTENAHAAALKNEAGELYEEPWGGYQLKPMCPATALWHDKVVDFCTEFGADYGFDGLYIDQVGSYNATLCFDDSHPHPLGGGTWWNEAYHAMLEQIAHNIGRDKILTTESCCETYIDVFDMFLILEHNAQCSGLYREIGGRNCEAIPLFHMIYGDYALSYGSICRFSDTPEVFAFNCVRNLLWGFIPTLEGGDMAALMREDAHRYFAILDKVIRFFQQNKPLFLYGRLTGIVSLPDTGSITISWDTGREVYTKSYPAVMQTQWETPDGTSTLLFYNFGDEEKEIALPDRRIKLLPNAFARYDL